MLYAANGTTGGIDVFNGLFGKSSVSGGFVDSGLPSGLVPFNVEDIGGKVYVAYAPATHDLQTMATAGMGAVAVFDENGDLLDNLVTGGPLAAPWGMAIAPANFGQFGGDLLVGNFSFVDSEINAFNATTGAFVATIHVDPGAGNTAGGLWDLMFGTGGPNRRPKDPLFHRRHQWRDGRPVRGVNRSRTVDLGDDAARVWRLALFAARRRASGALG